MFLPTRGSLATPGDLANAMDVPASDVLSESLMGSDPLGVLSSTKLGTLFPSRGETFAILATGTAADAGNPNDSESHSTTLGGIDNDQGNDLVRLHLSLRVPTGFDCLNFDFAFYTEEFAEFVGSEFNDAFTAQLNDSSLSVVGSEVSAPGNVAFDTQGHVISVNSVFGMRPDTGTTYDGVTPYLRASAPVIAGNTADVYLSIQDLGDSVYDSAVFIDNFFWSKDASCAFGAKVDSDQDGLLDTWETKGLTIGSGFVNLPAMGADPLHKDIFVEVDYMAGTDHTHKPRAFAMAMIMEAFAKAPVINPDGSPGIALHVDYGPEAPVSLGSSVTWGSIDQSRAESLQHRSHLGTGKGKTYSWAQFQAIKNAHFKTERIPVFHYGVWAHHLSRELEGVSGGSRGPDSEGMGPTSGFIVSLGAFPAERGTILQQAGTFMHELGHNLGLRHGGGDDDNYKPNYLSVMNYFFQMRGLFVEGTPPSFDYSPSSLPLLKEYELDETIGIGSPSPTRHFCGLDVDRDDFDGRSIDWNCDGDSVDKGIAVNINAGFPGHDTNVTFKRLDGFDDWPNLVYTGGAIGSPGANIQLSMETELDELTREEDRQIGISCQGFESTVSGTDGSDMLVGTAGNDVISGLGGKDAIRGLRGADRICAGPGDDTVLGGRGRDKVQGQGGNDALRGGKGTDRLVGGKGKDTCLGGSEKDTASGCERKRGIP